VVSEGGRGALRLSPVLPPGFAVGHWSDPEGWTGCTVVLAPEGCVSAAEVRGGGPGTREGDLLEPASAADGAHAVVLTGGSAFGLAAADGVVRYLEERHVGLRTRAALVPLVAGAVVYDLALGSASARPDAAAGYAACEAAGPVVERGSVGAGTGCTVGKLLGPDHWTKGGLGLASVELADGACVAALAVVNAFGEVIGEDGSVLAGVRRDEGYVRTAELLQEGVRPRRPWRESTTLVCVLTDARLTKTDAWRVARAASAGVARAVVPSATSFDGDVAYCLAGCRVDADPFVVATLAADVVSAAIRDGVRSATEAPTCPTARLDGPVPERAAPTSTG
jgi:L-aminopeptidase/D-esterase-like protein